MLCEHHALGGAGATQLGNAVIAACQDKTDFKFLYEVTQPIKVCASDSAITSGLAALLCSSATCMLACMIGKSDLQPM